MAIHEEIEGKRTTGLIVLCICMIIAAVLLMNLEAPRLTGSKKRAAASVAAAPVGATAEAPQKSQRAPEAAAQPGPQSAPQSGAQSEQPSAPRAASEHDAPPVTARVPLGASSVTEADVAALRVKDLLIPVAGVAPSQLRDSFYEGRSGGRQHEAIDIPAPKDTPVLATADGKVARLFQSAQGGTTLYELDASGTFYYYYAHLSHYADGISEGKTLKRGDVIAYVGDTGNAGIGNFHLHFAISKPSAPGKWSGGEAIDPFPILTKQNAGAAITGR